MDGTWGHKPFCSGSTRIDRALVTAECDDGYRLFDISVAENVVRVQPGSWPAVGMADSLSDTLDFGGPPVPASRAVGPPSFYLERPGFWFGGTGVAACWYGGARGLVEYVLRSVGPHPSELVVTSSAMPPPTSISCAGRSSRRRRRSTPTPTTGPARRSDGPLSFVTRCIMRRNRFWCTPPRRGSAALCLDSEQAQRAADLYVYLAQYHGPQDANVLGHMAGDGWPWS